MVLRVYRFNKERSKTEAEQFFWDRLREEIRKSNSIEEVFTIALDSPLKNSDINNPIEFSYKANGEREIIGYLFYSGDDDPHYKGKYMYAFFPERNAGDLVKKIKSLEEIHIDFPKQGDKK